VIVMRRRILLASVAVLAQLAMILFPVPADASGIWQPAVVLVPHPAGTESVVGAAGSDGLMHAFARDKGGTVLYLQGTGTRWSRTPTPYRGYVLAAATEGTTSYFLFDPIGPFVGGSFGYGSLWLGVRTAAGRYLPARQIAATAAEGVTSAALLVRGGHWWALWTLIAAGDTPIGLLMSTTDSTPTRRLAEYVGGMSEVTAAWTTQTDAAVLLVAGNWGADLRAPGALLFGHGSGTGPWVFPSLPGVGVPGLLGVPAGRLPKLVSRYGLLYAAWAGPRQIYLAHYDGRAWSRPATSVRLAVDPTWPGVLALQQAVSVGHQFIGWSDTSGMYVAEAPLSGPWTRTGFGHAGEPLLDAMTASTAKATLLYTVTFIRSRDTGPISQELRSRSQT
jgi:hypothetical protein